MKKRIVALLSIYLGTVFILVGCVSAEKSETEEALLKDTSIITPTLKETQLEDGFSTVRYEGDYGFDTFLEKGGASSDKEVIEFLARNMLSEIYGLSFQSNVFGCSTLSVSNQMEEFLFGRNFDWEQCNALVVNTVPDNGYESISTVNLDFLSGYGVEIEHLPSKVRTLAGIYAPLDGMNEKGFCAAVLMIQDSGSINQNSGKPGITTTTAIRLLLDKAANVDEALALLNQYDMNFSMGMIVHFALADATGRSVVVEYIDNEMVVVETPVVTNFYLADGRKNGVGTAQSHTRYEILMKQLGDTPTMSMEEVRDAMDSVSKDNFGEFESTEWSIVYNQSSGEVHYYHREKYDKSYRFFIGKN